MSKERLAAFSDAVLAIIMTIIVLELEIPNQVSLKGFWQMRNSFLAYTISFFWLGIMWIGLHNEWHSASKVDNRVIFTTLVLLFCSSLFPYATKVVSLNFHNSVAQGFYGVIALLITIANIPVSKSLICVNADQKKLVKEVEQHIKLLLPDIIVKLIGFIISITIYPPAMMISILVTAVWIIVSFYFPGLNSKVDL